MSDMIYDWDKATVRVRVPVHYTATSAEQEVNLPLGALAALLQQSKPLDVPLAVISPKEKGVSK